MKTTYILFLAILSLKTFAGVTVNWNMNDPADFVYLNDETTPVPFGSVWQLIWMENFGTPNSPDSTNPFVPTGGEVLLGSTRIPNTDEDDGYVFGVTISDVSTSFVGGFVYTRVFDFQDEISNFDPFVNSFFYGNSSVVSGPLGNTTSGDPSPALPTVHDPGSFTLNQQFVAIPEPGTLALILMAVGGIVYKLRRRRS
jgi:hypothetical protein